MKKRVSPIAISLAAALAGLAVLTLALAVHKPVRATMTASSVSVSITETGFDPAVLTISVGSTVTWTNLTQQTVHLLGGEPHHVFLPLVLRGAGGTRTVAVTPSQMPSAIANLRQDDWGNVDVAPGESYTHTFAIAGNYPYYLTEHPDRTGLVVVQEASTADFALAVTPGSRTVTQGQSVTYTVAVTATDGFSAPVTLSVTGLPAGAVADWNANPVTPTTGTVLVIQTAPDTPTSTYPLIVIGTGGGRMHSTPFSLTVLPMPAGPEPGHYTGTPSVSFDLTADQQVCNFDIRVRFGTGYCRIRPGSCADISGQDFTFSSAVIGAIYTITGTFDLPTHAMGGYRVSMCGDTIIIPAATGTWEANKE